MIDPGCHGLAYLGTSGDPDLTEFERVVVFLEIVLAEKFQRTGCGGQSLLRRLSRIRTRFQNLAFNCKAKNRPRLAGHDGTATPSKGRNI